MCPYAQLKGRNCEQCTQIRPASYALIPFFYFVELGLKK